MWLENNLIKGPFQEDSPGEVVCVDQTGKEQT